MAAPAGKWHAESRDAGSSGSIRAFAEVLETKAAVLELTGSAHVAADLRKWAAELRHQDRLHDFVQGGN